ncbi:MAG: hypothetical protein KF729_09055 [Sandaracinaceae bacterium]|nr:hypothetical protein [Sandaracinaceae bacterium]
MKAKRPRRAGATETFSVSVDRETKAALRALADEEFDGNLSALITDMAEDARRRMAAAKYLRRHGIPKLDEAGADALEASIAAEVVASTSKRKKSPAA